MNALLLQNPVLFIKFLIEDKEFESFIELIEVCL
jgi:hypothetical protein